MLRLQCPLRYALALILAGIAQPSSADVIVLANRAGLPVPFRFTPVQGQAQQLTLAVDENLPLYLDGKANIAFSSPGGPQNLLLDANCAYFFGRTNDGRIGLQKIGLGEDGTLAAGRDLPGGANRTPFATVTVKILVDEEEPGRRAVWENRLRRRVEAASAVFEKYFHTKFQVVGFDTWNSDNATNDFNASLAEFEREAKPNPARLAIGFTSQWRVERGRMHMAGTRGPLHTHILAREGNPELREPDRLEYLIHELGHFLGAAHCPERGSVMRPVLGDRQAGRVNSQIRFDPVNTLAMAIISEEMRRRNLKRIGELSADTRKRLGQIYMELARAMPDDPAAFHYAQLVKSESGSPVVMAARQVLQQIVRAAVDNRALPAATGAISKQPARRQGDELTEYLVREAARAAQSYPVGVREQAFLLAIAIGVGDSDSLSKVPTTATVLRAIEAPSERAIRLAVLGSPTMRGRRDLTRHFLMSALLTMSSNADAAQTAGLVKELADANSASGFSFADLAADRAGSRFARAVLDKKIPPGMLGLTFQVTSFMPDVSGLPEKLSAQKFAAQFGSKDDPRFVKQLQEIDQRITQLPGYRPVATLLSR
jgi:hypothetical protein